jgi:acyl dehydratase
MQESQAPKVVQLSGLLVPGNAGRAFGALTADRNPIHLSSVTSQVRGTCLTLKMEP